MVWPTLGSRTAKEGRKKSTKGLRFSGKVGGPSVATVLGKLTVPQKLCRLSRIHVVSVNVSQC